MRSADPDPGAKKEKKKKGWAALSQGLRGGIIAGACAGGAAIAGAAIYILRPPLATGTASAYTPILGA